ncbi:succinate dehydrogenase cytochrome b subunit [Cerasicoccus maritimus]|uniref:succinate dehydrogenase cytochrome b subunit n=1 Tax=Cerasicoccus maritimus TaxID=490089 RepID=UPI002852BCF5|nr:succinate dehydrogenase cytochrome b subunit [Cerasicoccus maritimus]
MSTTKPCHIPSLVKKYLMAISGLVLVLFIIGHMLGNLQFFLGPDVINAYAFHLHHLPGAPVTLWLIRGSLLAFLAIHVWMAVLLTKENRAARPESYLGQKTLASTYASRTMPVTGVLILAFIVFHILQYTTRVVPEHYNETIGTAMIEVGHVPLEYFDVFAMMVSGFSSPIISLFYIVTMALLCMHLSHGVASMFQSVGLRNEAWRYKLKCLAAVFGWVIFLGFASIPASVLAGFGKDYLAEKQAAWAGAAPAAETPAAHH